MITKQDIETATRDKLREYARELGITGVFRKTKSELAAIILEKIAQPETEDTDINPAVIWSESVYKMTDLKEIEQACDELNYRLNLGSMMPKSRKNKTRPYTNIFKGLKPTQETEHLFYEYQATGKLTSVTRHIVFRLLGLDDYVVENEKLRENKKQQTSKSQNISDVLNEEDKIFSVDRFLSTLKTLINSSDIWEIAVGLIAASGRRPIEILHTGNFELVDDCPNYLPHSQYAVKFTGQAKKRGENPDMFISLLIPSQEFIKAFKRFRNSKEYSELPDYVKSLESAKYSYQEINGKITSKYGSKLGRIISDYYEFMPKIDEDNAKNISLRASYSKLITLRDMGTKNFKSQLKYSGYMLGHLTPIIHEDGTYRHDTAKENRLSSTLLYGDYEPDTTEIPFLENIVKTTNQSEEEIMIINDLKRQLAEKDEEIKMLKEKLEAKKRNLPEPENMDNQTLFVTRKQGSSTEKLNRVWNAIVEYNDSTPEYKINPTNPILRKLTGVNGQTIKIWIEEHKIMIDDHTNKHGFNEYYNNKYRKSEITVDRIIETINEQYLN